MNDEQKTKEQLLEELEELRGSNVAFRDIAEQSADAIATTDLSGRVTYWSPGAASQTGYAAEEVVGTRLADFYFGGGYEEAKAIMDRLEREGQIRNYAAAIRKKDGDWIEQSVTISYLRDNSGTIIGTIGIAKDVTEQKRAEEALRKSQERSDALYRVSNLLAGAHDTDEVLDLIVNEATRLVGATAAMIRLLEGESLVRRAATKSVDKTGSMVLTVGEGVMGHVMASKKPWITENFADEELLSEEGRSEVQADGFLSAAIVPLLANGQSIGVLAAMDTRIRRFTDEEVSLLTAFADQASLALEKARLLNEAETERERSDALYRVSNLLAGAHDTDEVLELIVDEAARLVGVPLVSILLLEMDSLAWGVATEAADRLFKEFNLSFKVEEGTSLAGHVMATKKPLFGDAAAKLLTPAFLRIIEKQGLDSAALGMIPLLANDRSLGVLLVMDTGIRRFTEDEVSLLMAFADQAALALEKARLLNEAEARERQATQLYEVTTQLASNHDLKSVLDLITEQAAELMGGTSGMLFQFDESKGGLLAISIFNMVPEIKDTVFFPGQGAAGRAYQNREVFWTSDYGADLENSAISISDPALQGIVRSQISKTGSISVIAAPIMINNNVWGVLDVVFDTKREFGEE